MKTGPWLMARLPTNYLLLKLSQVAEGRLSLRSEYRTSGDVKKCETFRILLHLHLSTLTLIYGAER